MYCNKCGANNPEDNNFCEKCGSPLVLPISSEAGIPGKSVGGGTQPLTALKMANDMKFVGMFGIIYGAITCLSIIGAIIGIPLIIYSLRLREAADAFTLYQNSNDVNMLHRAFELQGGYFFFQKLMIIIGLVLFALYIIIYVLFFLVVLGGSFS